MGCDFSWLGEPRKARRIAQQYWESRLAYSQIFELLLSVQLVVNFSTSQVLCYIAGFAHSIMSSAYCSFAYSTLAVQDGDVGIGVFPDSHEQMFS